MSHDELKSLRELNVEARRQRILGAARQLITRGGLRALSMRKLAAEARLAVTTLYNLFGSREDILGALVDDAVDRMDQMLDREAPLEQDGLERCRAVITVSIRYLCDQEAVFRPMLIAHHHGGLALGDDYDRRIADRATEMQRVGLAQALTQGQITDLLDPRSLAQQIYHGYELAHQQWGLGQLDEDGFRSRALYGLYVGLLGVATDASRPQIEAELHELEKQLSSKPLSASRKGAVA